METTTLLNIATLKAFPLAYMKDRSFFITYVGPVDTFGPFFMPGRDWKYHFHLVLGASCMASLSNSNTHCSAGCDCTSRLSKKHSESKHCVYAEFSTTRGELHAWLAFLINMVDLSINCGKGRGHSIWIDASILHRMNII